MSSEPETISGDAAARSPIALIRDLQSGAMQARSLSRESRRACVEHLAADGWSIAEIAEVLKISDRTVHRDVAAIREANAVEADENTTAIMVGRLLSQADQSIGRLRRIARERDCEPAVRVEAERSAWMIARELFELFQRVGYLPTAPQQVEAAVLHRHEEPPSAAQLEAEARRVLVILKESGDTGSDTLEQLTTLQDSLARSAAAESLLDQLRQFPRAAHDDGPDALQMAVFPSAPPLLVDLLERRVPNLRRALAAALGTRHGIAVHWHLDPAGFHGPVDNLGQDFAVTVRSLGREALDPHLRHEELRHRRRRDLLDARRSDWPEFSAPVSRASALAAEPSSLAGHFQCGADLRLRRCGRAGTRQACSPQLLAGQGSSWW